MADKTVDIEKLLSEDNTIAIKPQGWSMYPLIVYGRDEVIIEPVNDACRLKRSDVVLYRRKEENILVLHRIYKSVSKGESRTYYMVGDNQTEIEGPIYPEQIKGKMAAVIRKDKIIMESNLLYKIYSFVWLMLRPVRPVIGKVVHNVCSKKH